MSFWSPIIPAEVTENTETQVLIQRGEWVDINRGDRVVPYKIYTPKHEGGGPCPTIIWSHGLGGSRDGAGFISRFVASYGYAVVHIQHKGSDSGLWEGKPGHPWDVIRATHIPRKATLQRLLDVPFALNQLEKMQIPEMDLSRLGMSGHSFGAMTTQTMAGQHRGLGRRLYDLFEERFKAAIAYSPVPVTYKAGHEVSDFYGGIRIPMLYMTGTDDSSPVNAEITYQTRIEVFEHAKGPEQHLLVLEDGDHMVYNGSRGQLGENPKRDIHEKIIKLASLAFWDAYLKGDDKAKKWLVQGDFQQWLGNEAEYRFRA